jgi:hypothetical protein
MIQVGDRVRFKANERLSKYIKGELTVVSINSPYMDQRAIVRVTSTHPSDRVYISEGYYLYRFELAPQKMSVLEKIKYLDKRYAERRTRMGLGNNNLQQGQPV